MTFFTEASLDLADDPELMRMMVDANIDTVFIGIETPNEAALRETKKLQNVRGQGGSMLEKIHRVQENGIEVWSGMILGFDSDDASIFDAQRQFIREARIVNPMVGMLSAIPKTPLYRRLQIEGRLDPADAPAYGTNVIPLRIDRAILRDGYLSVLRDLHLPEAYFARLDSLYFGTGIRLQQARKRYLKKRPWRRLRFEWRMMAETAVIMVRLLRHVSETRLRHEYLKRMWNIVKRRREPLIWQVYAMKCAMHYHVHTLVREMTSGDGGPIRNSF